MMLSFFAAQALDSHRELDLTLGVLGNSDPSWGTFSEAASLTSFGVHGGVPVAPGIKLVGGYEYGSTGMRMYISDYWDDNSDEDGGSHSSAGYEFRTGFFAHQALLGAKVHVEPSKWVSLYGTLQADALIATVRIDDDPDDDENPGQVERSGFTAGGIAALGVEALVPIGESGTSWAFHGELGYGLLAPLQVEDVATLQFGGAAVRLGTGLRF
jgi:hypothetical protein